MLILLGDDADAELRRRCHPWASGLFEAYFWLEKGFLPGGLAWDEQGAGFCDAMRTIAAAEGERISEVGNSGGQTIGGSRIVGRRSE